MKIMKVLVLIVATLALVVGSNAAVSQIKNKCVRDAQNRIFEGKITEALHKLRDQLKAGNAEKGIPPLDPLNLNNFALRVDNALANLNWTMNGLVNGLMSWNLTNVRFQMLGYKLTYEITFGPIDARGDYNVDGNLIQILPLYGKGAFNAQVDNLVISGTGKFSVSIWTQAITLEKFSCNINLQDFLFKITGLMNDEPLSQLISQMVSESVPELLETFRAQLDSVISSIVIQAANNILGKDKDTEQELRNLLSFDSEEYELFARQCY